MNAEKLVKLCLINDDAIETRPFTDKKYQPVIVMRHKSNNKWFALIFTMDDKLYINLKAQPQLIALLKEQYEAITPAWHMNKKHWCKVDVNAIELGPLNELIKTSFEITASKKRNTY